MLYAYHKVIRVPTFAGVTNITSFIVFKNVLSNSAFKLKAAGNIFYRNLKLI